ncbi:hypothetical protein KEX41_29100 (plasmid) [Burkholderia thailandensis]|uniref:hypothetical protein n=1 Tax=Burkholderia thailandensis TaxID=57975 RepID=UPI00192D7BE0|nr:hypothetical protein [Burkholderia thailandensis]MBS2132244.1 hypothetical protein [Burkholderia thailandensis]QRA15336.1 hypothetical protein JMY07_29525 [Burkholderia thailandensis]
MNTKRLSLSVLFALAVGFAGIAEAATNPPAAQETAPSTMGSGDMGMMGGGGMGMMGHGGMGMMGMGSCPMMGGAHLSGKDTMLMHADMLQAMSKIMRKYADKASD